MIKNILSLASNFLLLTFTGLIIYSYKWIDNFYYHLIMTIILGIGLLAALFTFFYLFFNYKKVQSFLDNEIVSLINQQQEVFIECPNCKKIHPINYFPNKSNFLECPVCGQSNSVNIKFTSIVVSEPLIANIDNIKELPKNADE